MDPERRAVASIAIGEDHAALAAAVRRFLAERCPPASVRAVVDGDAQVVPELSARLAAQGWLGLHLPESRGGEGYGLAEAVIVAEELGRALTPGPALPTLWAGAALAGGGPAELAKALATGQVSGAVALGPALDGQAEADGTVVVSGSTGPVLGGDVAAVVVVAVAVDGEERWYAVEPGAFSTTTLSPFDPTRSVGQLVLDGARLADADRIDGLDRRRVEMLTGTLAAAECAGVASWCVDTAATYACDRRQFGRPIGQFQAVKHRCADMLTATESARSAAWDAARAVDELDGGTEEAPADGGGCTLDEAALVVASAVSVALDAAVRTAEDCIQVLGGIGFTWEHAAHLYLRRAVAVRQLFGGTGASRRAVAEAALAGTRRRLRVTLPAEAEPLRAEVRAAVEEVAALPKEERQARLADLGLLVPHWPRPWGRDAGAVEQLLIDEELRRARVRLPHLQVGAWAAPTIVAHGTDEQQERWVRPTLYGEIAWCQLFSEPEAGSDLAALRTTGTRVDGGWRIDGQKVWTTMAAEADWGICLVRTNPDAPKHLGITYLIVDMRADGIEIRPLREMTGLAMFNEVFFDGAFVPDECVIGEVDGGWPLARTTLGNERVAMGSGSSFGGGIEALLALVGARRDRGALDVDRALLDQLGALVAESHVVAVLGARSTHRSVSGARPGPESSVRKLLGVEHDQRTQELGLGLLGPWGATVEDEAAQWTFGFLANRCLTIAGGTSEIQRNVIGERLLGLPRDPEPQ
ncbi:MAG: acyl-CoA dehydrogenase [Acidimicrobiales bacterium]|nr:acyl-CoA dehydrogenase [Acidimicrobiales bacterium]